MPNLPNHLQTGAKLVIEEALKSASDYLRGNLAISLQDAVTGSISEDDGKLLKFHGSYMQDDRDLRVERQKQKLEPAYSFMVRVRMPGGVCTPQQWLVLDQLARDYANGTIRLTTRQTVQYHGVDKRHLKTLIVGINDALLSTLATCGDVNRNIICHNNPYLSTQHAELLEFAYALTERLAPRTSAYGELWLGRRRSAPDDEPLYGKTYLPRKFKIGIALPPYNDVDVYAQDLGFIAIVQRGKWVGCNVTVGGGMGTTQGDAATYARAASVLGYCRREHLLEVAEQVLAVQRDYGDRTNRRHARLKYTVDDHGVQWYRAQVEQRLGFALEDAKTFRFADTGDRYGWQKDKRGLWHCGLFVPGGRVQDVADVRFMSALREIAKVHTGDIRLSANQNLLIANVAPEAKPSIEALLDKYGVVPAEKLAPLTLNSMACVGLPTCGLAMAESERALPDMLAELEQVLERLGLGQQAITLRVTGCPNGCARPFLAEIGLVGKSPGRYHLWLGASTAGDRLNMLYREDVADTELVGILTLLFEHYANDRLPGEGFGDFVLRAGYVKPVVRASAQTEVALAG